MITQLSRKAKKASRSHPQTTPMTMGVKGLAMELADSQEVLPKITGTLADSQNTLAMMVEEVAVPA